MCSSAPSLRLSRPKELPRHDRHRPLLPVHAVRLCPAGRQTRDAGSNQRTPRLELQGKLDARMAAAYIATGSYRWSAGMFVTQVSFLMDFLREYKPELAECLTRIAAVWDVDEARRNKLLEEIWPGLDKIAIDSAVEEPAALEGRVAVVPATFGTLYNMHGSASTKSTFTQVGMTSETSRRSRSFCLQRQTNLVSLAAPVSVGLPRSISVPGAYVLDSPH